LSVTQQTEIFKFNPTPVSGIHIDYDARKVLLQLNPRNVNFKGVNHNLGMFYRRPEDAGLVAQQMTMILDYGIISEAIREGDLVTANHLYIGGRIIELKWHHVTFNIAFGGDTTSVKHVGGVGYPDYFQNEGWVVDDNPPILFEPMYFMVDEVGLLE
jgi:hypothetical protein